MALGVLQAAYKQGIRIPEDLALVGYDNIPESAYFCPPLTTVQQQLIDQGKNSVCELLRIIEADQQIEDVDIELPSVFLEPQLVIRESSKRQ
jgi:DNA-binding LacI/PurR family transcriptional regulator